MILTISGLPKHFNYHDAKAMIKQEAHITNFILDNMTVDGGGKKKVTVGLADGAEAPILISRLNGFQILDHRLTVAPLGNSQPSRPSAREEPPRAFAQRGPEPLRSAPSGPGYSYDQRGHRTTQGQKVSDNGARPYGPTSEPRVTSSAYGAGPPTNPQYGGPGRAPVQSIAPQGPGTEASQYAGAGTFDRNSQLPSYARPGLPSKQPVLERPGAPPYKASYPDDRGPSNFGHPANQKSPGSSLLKTPTNRDFLMKPETQRYSPGRQSPPRKYSPGRRSPPRRSPPRADLKIDKFGATNFGPPRTRPPFVSAQAPPSGNYPGGSYPIGGEDRFRPSQIPAAPASAGHPNWKPGPTPASEPLSRAPPPFGNQAPVPFGARGPAQSDQPGRERSPFRTGRLSSPGRRVSRSPPRRSPGGAWRGPGRSPPRGPGRSPPRGPGRSPPRGPGRSPPRGPGRSPPHHGDYRRSPPREKRPSSPPRNLQWETNRPRMRSPSPPRAPNAQQAPRGMWEREPPSAVRKAPLIDGLSSRPEYPPSHRDKLGAPQAPPAARGPPWSDSLPPRDHIPPRFTARSPPRDLGPLSVGEPGSINKSQGLRSVDSDPYFEYQEKGSRDINSRFIAGPRDLASRDFNTRDRPREFEPQDLGPRDIAPRDIGARDVGSQDRGLRDMGPRGFQPREVGPRVIGRDSGPGDMGPRGSGPGDMGPRGCGPADMGPRGSGPRDIGPREFGPRDMGPREFGRDDGPRDMGPRDREFGLRDGGPRDIGREFGAQHSGRPDMGPRDFGSRDNGLRDMGPRDIGLREFGPRDDGPRDMGAREFEPRHSGPRDMGPRDFNPRDIGPRDIGPRDSGPRDFGSRDFRPRDGGPRDMGAREFAPRDGGPREFGREDRPRDFGPRGDEARGFGPPDRFLSTERPNRSASYDRSDRPPLHRDEARDDRPPSRHSSNRSEERSFNRPRGRGLGEQEMEIRDVVVEKFARQIMSKYLLPQYMSNESLQKNIEHELKKVLMDRIDSIFGIECGHDFGDIARGYRKEHKSSGDGELLERVRVKCASKGYVRKRTAEGSLGPPAKVSREIDTRSLPKHDLPRSSKPPRGSKKSGASGTLNDIPTYPMGGGDDSVPFQEHINPRFYPALLMMKNPPQKVPEKTKIAHKLYLTKEDLSPITADEATQIKTCFVDEIVKATTNTDFTPSFLINGVQNFMYFEVIAEDEKSRHWLQNRDLSGFKPCNILVYTLEELTYERVSIFLPGHTDLPLKPLEKLKLQNSHLKGLNFDKWKLVKIVVTPQGTRLFLDMDKPSTQALNNWALMLCYELGKVFVFLKCMSTDRGEFEQAFQEKSVSSQTVIPSVPIVTSKLNKDTIRISLEGQKLTIEMASTIKNLIISKIFQYLQTEDSVASKTEFVDHGFCVAGFFAIFPGNHQSANWLLSLDLGEIEGRKVLIEQGLYFPQYLRVEAYLPGETGDYGPSTLQKIYRDNKIEGVDVTKWKLVSQQLTKDEMDSTLTLDVDFASMKGLKRVNFKIQFGSYAVFIKHKHHDVLKESEEALKESQDHYEIADMDIDGEDDKGNGRRYSERQSHRPGANVADDNGVTNDENKDGNFENSTNDNEKIIKDSDTTANVDENGDSAILGQGASGIVNVSTMDDVDKTLTTDNVENASNDKIANNDNKNAPDENTFDDENINAHDSMHSNADEDNTTDNFERSTDNEDVTTNVQNYEVKVEKAADNDTIASTDDNITVIDDDVIISECNNDIIITIDSEDDDEDIAKKKELDAIFRAISKEIEKRDMKDPMGRDLTLRALYDSRNDNTYQWKYEKKFTDMSDKDLEYFHRQVTRRTVGQKKIDDFLNFMNKEIDKRS